ncbi:hypothetical protein J6590_071679 [Homalodisca vitripennis]|nr:hypothetical protein J6590_071679 [Homalodisca vitripennis]
MDVIVRADEYVRRGPGLDVRRSESRGDDDIGVWASLRNTAATTCRLHGAGSSTSRSTIKVERTAPQRVARRSRMHALSALCRTVLKRKLSPLVHPETIESYIIRQWRVARSCLAERGSERSGRSSSRCQWPDSAPQMTQADSRLAMDIVPLQRSGRVDGGVTLFGTSSRPAYLKCPLEQNCCI